MVTALRQGDDEFGSHTQNDALRKAIVAEVRRAGAISFHRFMDLVLYHPRWGYYSSRDQVIGRTGDFLTSPELSPLFGAMLGRQAVEVWQALGEPSEFTIVEAGPGNATLAVDLLEWAARTWPEPRPVLRYVLIERSPALRERQQRRLAGYGAARWVEDVPVVTHGLILSNELLDAFPVHLVYHDGDRLFEGSVIEQNGGLTAAFDRPARSELITYFDALGFAPPVHGVAEVNLDAVAWMRGAAARLEHGMLLTLDYGYPASKLYAPWRTQGTLLCFHKHSAGDDPFVRLGHQDITSHIDFTSIARAAHEQGLEVAGFTNQREYLSALGIHEALNGVGTTPGDEHLARYRAITDLLAPEGLGRVGVLAMTRGLEGVPWRGFPASADAERALAVAGHREIATSPSPREDAASP